MTNEIEVVAMVRVKKTVSGLVGFAVFLNERISQIKSILEEVVKFVDLNEYISLESSKEVIIFISTTSDSVFDVFEEYELNLLVNDSTFTIEYEHPAFEGLIKLPETITMGKFSLKCYTGKPEDGNGKMIEGRLLVVPHPDSKFWLTSW